MLPVESYSEGLKKDILVNFQDRCVGDVAYVDLKLKLDIFPEGLSDPSFKWVLYEGNIYINEGDFDGYEEGDIIDLTTSSLEVSSNTTYTLYIYIDGNMDNDYTMGDNFFKFSLYGEGTRAIYNGEITIDNTMITMSSSSTSSFLLANNEHLLKNNIGEIEILPFSEVSNGATYAGSIGQNESDVLYVF